MPVPIGMQPINRPHCRREHFAPVRKVDQDEIMFANDVTDDRVHLRDVLVQPLPQSGTNRKWFEHVMDRSGQHHRGHAHQVSEQCVVPRAEIVEINVDVPQVIHANEARHHVSGLMTHAGKLLVNHMLQPSTGKRKVDDLNGLPRRADGISEVRHPPSKLASKAIEARTWIADALRETVSQANKPHNVHDDARLETPMTSNDPTNSPGAVVAGDGPFYDDLHVGMTIPPLPPVTFTDADSVIYRAVCGDQHLPSVDGRVFKAMGGAGSMVNPGLVMQYAVGQTTGATRRAIANLYYRTVRIHRPVTVGETLSTESIVLGLSDASAKDGQARGKVWLSMKSKTDAGLIVSFERCALLPCRGEAPGHRSEIPGPAEHSALDSYVHELPTWNLSGLTRTAWEVGERREDAMRDHVDMAAPLARMTFNQAVVHRDHTRPANGMRLVYGGHVQALAQASLTRLLPGMATVLGWDGCDHLGPAYEGDLFAFTHHLLEALPTANGQILRFEVTGRKVTGDHVIDSAATDVLRWTAVVLAP
jgi:2-methylfumaryl-CoA hydratase